MFLRQQLLLLLRLGHSYFIVATTICNKSGLVTVRLKDQKTNFKDIFVSV